MSFPVRTSLVLMLLASLLVAGLLLAVPAGAAKPKSGGNDRAASDNAPAARPDAISKDEAVAMVRARTGGKVLRAERVGEQGRAAYRIRVLTPDGRVREHRVDATTGAMD
jgi:uncharacterized membrane protein YkoI